MIKQATDDGPLAVITGGTGFLGGHLSSTLTALGWRVRSLSRRGIPARCAPPSVGQIEYHAVDMLDIDAVTEACQGADAIYHLAGSVSRDPVDTGRLHELHVKGSQNFIQVVDRLEIRYAVYLRTSGVIGVSKDPEILDEHAHYA